MNEQLVIHLVRALLEFWHEEYFSTNIFNLEADEQYSFKQFMFNRYPAAYDLFVYATKEGVLSPDEFC